jgi:hypothetical protein
MLHGSSLRRVGLRVERRRHLLIDQNRADAAPSQFICEHQAAGPAADDQNLRRFLAHAATHSSPCPRETLRLIGNNRFRNPAPASCPPRQSKVMEWRRPPYPQKRTSLKRIRSVRQGTDLCSAANYGRRCDNPEQRIMLGRGGKLGPDQPQRLDIRSRWPSVVSIAKSMRQRHVNENRSQIGIPEDDDEGAYQAIPQQRHFTT